MFPFGFYSFELCIIKRKPPHRRRCRRCRCRFGSWLTAVPWGRASGGSMSTIRGGAAWGARRESAGLRAPLPLAFASRSIPPTPGWSSRWTCSSPSRCPTSRRRKCARKPRRRRRGRPACGWFGNGEGKRPNFVRWMRNEEGDSHAECRSAAALSPSFSLSSQRLVTYVPQVAGVHNTLSIRGGSCSWSC